MKAVIASLNIALQTLLPARSSISWREQLRSSFGALVAISATGLISAELLRSELGAIWLIAPMGASAVLLFALPASPLAQPWPLIGGNLVSVLIGVTCARWVGEPVWAAALSVALAICAMLSLRCLHPPSGAVALTAVLGGPEISASGFHFLLTPVLLDSVVILALAVAVNRVAGRRYPHKQRPMGEDTAALGSRAMGRMGFNSADLQAVVNDYPQFLDISADELEGLFLRTELLAFRRLFGNTQCREAMSSEVVSVRFSTELGEAWQLMNERGVHALPVTDAARRVIGIVTRADFLIRADFLSEPNLGRRLQAFLRRNPSSHSDRHEVVGQIMTYPVNCVPGHSPMIDLVPLMSGNGHHHLPVLDHERRLIGMFTQADLVAALYEILLNQVRSASTSVKA